MLYKYRVILFVSEEFYASDRSVHMPRLKTGKYLHFADKTEEEEEEEEEGCNLYVYLYVHKASLGGTDPQQKPANCRRMRAAPVSAVLQRETF
jgi:hypothetical protein